MKVKYDFCPRHICQSGIEILGFFYITEPKPMMTDSCFKLKNYVDFDNIKQYD